MNTSPHLLPWIPPGVTGTAPLSATPGRHASHPGPSVTSNVIAQAGFEHHASRLRKTGSIETTVYDAKPLAPGAYSTFSSIRNAGRLPKLALPQKSAAAKRQRVYVSLDAPGMGTGAPDSRMDRAQVGQQYRESYRTQQIQKKQPGLIPATFHAETSLRAGSSIGNLAAPQTGGGLSKKERGAMDQEADVAKYKHSYGILPASFDALRKTVVHGSERLAVGKRADRSTLSAIFDPSTIVHPSTLRTRSEQMDMRRSTRKVQGTQDRLIVNPAFARQAALAKK